MENPTPKPKGKKGKKLLIILGLATILVLGWNWHSQTPKIPQLPAASAEPLRPAKNANPEKAAELAEAIERMIAQHDSLPERSPLGMGLLGPSQASNEKAMSELMDVLVQELGNSRAFGALRALAQTREKAMELEGLTKSDNPETVEKAQKELVKNAEVQKQLAKEVQIAFERDGMPLTEDEVKSLALSPNREETASLIAAFGALKKISETMEDRMRASPTQEAAQKYYGSHCVLLHALDHIQKKAAAKIIDVHIPKTQQIIEEAHARSAQARKLLQTREGELSLNQKSALEANILGCKATIELAEVTDAKLRQNLKILIFAETSLNLAIQTAENSHATALLQKEILILSANHTEEIGKIQALTIPEMAAINFADPTKPQVTTKKKATPL